MNSSLLMLFSPNSLMIKCRNEGIRQADGKTKMDLYELNCLHNWAVNQ